MTEKREMELYDLMDELVALGWTPETFDEDFDSFESDEVSPDEKEVCREILNKVWEDKLEELGEEEFEETSEDIQKMLDKLCEAIQETVAGGQGNYLERLELIHRDKDENTWGGFFPKGDYVRFVWHELGPRDDGYYDINVTCCSGIGVYFAVADFLKTIW